MDFSFTQEQQMFRQMFADFVAKEIEPKAEHIDAGESVPPRLLENCAMQGFLGALLPEDFMGAELDAISYLLLLEEVAGSCMSTALTLHVHNSLVSRALLLHGSEAHKEQWLPAMAEGAAIGAWAAHEPEMAQEAALGVTAQPDGDGFRLDGVKTWVANAGVAGLFVVSATTPAGPTLFLVPSDAAGLKLGRREPTLGMRGVQIHPVYFDGVALEDDHLLGQPGNGAEVVAAVGDFARLAMGAIALGGAQHALDLGVQFAIERSQFGTPIANKGAIQGFIADSALEVETLRSQVYRGASLAEQGRLDAEAAAIAKLWANRVAYQVANRMIQTHGGYGYINEYAIGRVYRDCRTVQGIEGSDASQQKLIARSQLAAHGFEMADV